MKKIWRLANFQFKENIKFTLICIAIMTVIETILMAFTIKPENAFLDYGAKITISGIYFVFGIILATVFVVLYLHYNGQIRKSSKYTFMALPERFDNGISLYFANILNAAVIIGTIFAFQVLLIFLWYFPIIKLNEMQQIAIIGEAVSGYNELFYTFIKNAFINTICIISRANVMNIILFILAAAILISHRRGRSLIENIIFMIASFFTVAGNLYMRVLWDYGPKIKNPIFVFTINEDMEVKLYLFSFLVIVVSILITIIRIKKSRI